MTGTHLHSQTKVVDRAGGILYSYVPALPFLLFSGSAAPTPHHQRTRSIQVLFFAFSSPARQSLAVSRRRHLGKLRQGKKKAKKTRRSLEKTAFKAIF